MKRWYIYAGIGLVFGFIDWFYLDWLAHISWGSLGESTLVIPIIILLNYGIWLVPIIPAVIIATRNGQRIWDPILIGIITWIFALVGYYAYYWALLSGTPERFWGEIYGFPAGILADVPVGHLVPVFGVVSDRYRRRYGDRGAGLVDIPEKTRESTKLIVSKNIQAARTIP